LRLKSGYQQCVWGVGQGTILCLMYPRLLTVPKIHAACSDQVIDGFATRVKEIVLLRAFTTVPMYFRGYSEQALYACIFFVYLFSVIVHSNLRFPFGFLQHILCTPRFHHWHQGVEKESININYAVHVPILYRIFGTHHLPGEE
jgi:sterol desaturase/sphingolipid hydroxylase (fatty acid hydroxylase superfamily)